MKRKGLPVCLLALLCIFLFAACGGDHAASAAKLVSGYYGASDAAVVVLGTESYGGGYLATAMYSGGGNHLALFKIEKDSDGNDAIAAVSEGAAGKDGGYSMNILADGGKTILFGDFGGLVCSKIAFTFDDGTKVTESAGGKGYIIVADGSLKVKDFTFFGPGDAAIGSYQEFMNAGGSIIRSGFVPVDVK